MLLSCEYYRRAMSLTRDKRDELLRRLASVLNELAVRYMNEAQRESISLKIILNLNNTIKLSFEKRLYDWIPTTIFDTRHNDLLKILAFYIHFQILSIYPIFERFVRDLYPTG